VSTIDYPPRPSSYKVKIVRSPWGQMLAWYFINAFIIGLVAPHDSFYKEVLYVELIYTVGFYVYFRAMYKTIYLYPDKLKIIFPALSFRKNRIYKLSNIDYILFQILPKDEISDQYFKIHFKNGKKKRYWLPSDQLFQFRTYTGDIGIVVKNSR
jgi:hypothetical protein